MTEYYVDANTKNSQEMWGKDKLSFSDCLNISQAGDVIILSPGVYQFEDFENGVRYTPAKNDAENTTAASDTNYFDAYKNSGIQNIPKNPVIIRGETGNPDDVTIVSRMKIDNTNVAFEDLTIASDGIYNGIVGANGSSIAFINCKLLSGKNKIALIWNDDPNTQITIASSVIQPMEDITNFYNEGPTSIYNSDIQSLLILRKKANVFANQSNLSDIEVYDESQISSLNCKFQGDYYLASDNTVIDFSDSVIDIKGCPFAYATENAILKADPVTLTGDGTTPAIKLDKNGQFNFNVVNPDGPYAGVQVQVYQDDEDNSSSDLDDYNSDFDNIDDFSEPEDNKLDDNRIIVSNDEELVNAVNNAYVGQEIFLKAGDYKYNNKINVFRNLSFVGEDLARTTITLGVPLVPGENSSITLKNLRLRKTQDSVNEPIVGTDKENSKIIIDNCFIENNSEHFVPIFTEGEGTCLCIKHVKMIDKYAGVSTDISLSSNSSASIDDSFIYRIQIDKNSQTTISHSDVGILELRDNSKANVNDSTLETACSVLENSNLYLDHVKILQNIFDGNNVSLNSNSRLILQDSEFIGHSDVELQDNTQLKLHLLDYNSDDAITVNCIDPDTQIVNDQNWKININVIKPEIPESTDVQNAEIDKETDDTMEETDSYQFCPNCGAQNLGDSKFCTSCGTKLQ